MEGDSREPGAVRRNPRFGLRPGANLEHGDVPGIAIDLLALLTGNLRCFRIDNTQMQPEVLDGHIPGVPAHLVILGLECCKFLLGQVVLEMMRLETPIVNLFVLLHIYVAASHSPSSILLLVGNNVAGHRLTAEVSRLGLRQRCLDACFQDSLVIFRLLQQLDLGSHGLQTLCETANGS